MTASRAPSSVGLGLVLCGSLLAALSPGCTCESRGPRDPVTRPDGAVPDAFAEVEDDAGSSVDDPDASLDARIDANLDAFDPSTIDANQDVGPIDAFHDDAASSSTGMDSGASARRDASGDTAPDVRPPFGACGILWERGDPLPESCLPRCARDTAELFEACAGDPVCEAYATVRDTSRTGLLYVWEEEEITEVDCESCVGTQRFSCWYDPCPDQAARWVDCLALRDSEACARDEEILQRCLMPMRAVVDRCEAERVALCFP